ncbi:MAG TPA: GGDEF domain-containing protein [Acidobacteriaceae bacterium]|nr:GGDEF domain-containing protein [Acidobacteriaceae bacterium]
MPEEQSSQAIALKVVDHVDSLLGYWDRHLRCRFANAAYKTWFGRTREQMIGTHMREVLGPLFERNLPHIQAALAGQTQIFEVQVQIADGTLRDSLAAYYPDIENGVVAGFAVQLADVTKMKQLERELARARDEAQKLATHDYLTGLPNRVLLLDRLEKAIVHAERCRGMVGVVLIDLDGFKHINDSHGHAVGDLLLCEIAGRMRTIMRASDTVTRFGGDEFVLCVEEAADADHVLGAARRLQLAIAHPFQLGAIQVTTSISCGIALFPAHALEPNRLLELADRALYRAKAAGGNRIEIASGS